MNGIGMVYAMQAFARIVCHGMTTIVSKRGAPLLD